MKKHFPLLAVILAVPLVVFAATNAFDRADWGPAYVPGMEHGPASKDHSVAAHKAEAFMAQQKFASQYAKRACAVSGSDPIDVSFALVSDKSGKTRGIVGVSAKTGECSWLGDKAPNHTVEPTRAPEGARGSP